MEEQVKEEIEEKEEIEQDESTSIYEIRKSIGCKNNRYFRKAEIFSEKLTSAKSISPFSVPF